MNKRPKKEKPPEPGAPLWMLSYGDFMTNLLCCFVMLFSFANVDKVKLQQVAASMRAAFSSNVFQMDSGDTLIDLTPYKTASLNNEDSDYNEPGKMESDKSEWDTSVGTGKIENKQYTVSEAKVDVEKLIKDMGLDENIKVIEEEDLVIFRIDSIIIFDTGKADIKESVKPTLEKLGNVLKNLKTDIIVQGHADDRPINTREFPSNWELSTKRAVNVVKYLAEKCGIEYKYMTATGNGEYKPIVPNNTEYNRSKNRRIDIVIAK